jgi:hypothetical protein
MRPRSNRWLLTASWPDSSDVRRAARTRPVFFALATAALAATYGLKVAAPGLLCEGVSVSACTALNERLAETLRQHGHQVVTQRDMAVVLGMERQRQLMGCREGSESCLAELAGALGVDGVVQGGVVRPPSTVCLGHAPPPPEVTSQAEQGPPSQAGPAVMVLLAALGPEATLSESSRTMMGWSMSFTVTSGPGVLATVAYLAERCQY